MSKFEFGIAVSLWLRWYDRAGNWVPTNLEDKVQARQEVDRERQRADEANQRAELLAAKLRELGVAVN